MGEVTAFPRTSQIPRPADATVLHEFNQCPFDMPAGVLRLYPLLCRLVEGVNHFTVHVELKLRRSGIANAHRAGFS
jgi:hypothetical protein